MNGHRLLAGAIAVLMVVGSGMHVGADDRDALEPEPYDPLEFPAWSHDLRRGEIIAIGTFPIAMIVTGVAYELGRFGWNSIAAGRTDAQSAPGFLSPEGGPMYTNDERIALVTTAAVISLGVALADWLLGRRADAAESPYRERGE